VHHFDESGKEIKSFGASMFVWPHGIHVDRDGNVWVADSRAASAEELTKFPGEGKKGSVVVKFSPDGKVLMTLGKPGVRGNPPEALTDPTDVVTDPRNGDVYVAESHTNVSDPNLVGRISVFDKGGKFLRVIGKTGTGPGDFRTPHALEFDSQGRLIVADRHNHRIQILTRDGKFVREYDDFGRISGLAIDKDDVIYTADSESTERVHPGWKRGIRIGSLKDGKVTIFIPPHAVPNSADGAMGEGIAIDAAGNIYTAEAQLRGVTKYVAAQQASQSGASAPQQGPGAAPGRGGRGAQPGLEPRIITFEAKPATTKAGQPVLLVWQTENPTGVTIEPEIGAVTPRGSRQVMPSSTTTYTLAVKGGPSRTVTVTVEGAAPRGAAAAARAGTSGVPRMADGKPDLSGVYGSAGLPQGATPPALKTGAEKFRIIRGANDIRGRTTLTTGNDCKPLGIPQTYITPYPFQFVQTQKLMVIVYEYPMAVRFVPLDGRPQAVDPDPSWMGTSVGRWDGDTLVIDAIGFNDKTEVHGFMHTEALHVVERFRKLENGNLQYDVTVEDPNVWETPWVIPARTFAFRPEFEFVSEFVCESTVDYQRLFKR
jgi:DNA-binding beta-propeller fold protein YncE